MSEKDKWGVGPWQHEPDRLEWRYLGFPCLMVRHERAGHWCGYVGIPPEHPWYRKYYTDDAVQVSVHGGLTYANECDGHVCHVAQPGEPEHVWWFGFDCAHCDDLSPGFEGGESYHFPSAIYRTERYVHAETNRLAKQLKEVVCPPKSR